MDQLNLFYSGKNRIPFDESLKFVLEERKITQLSVCKKWLIEDDNDVEG